MAMVMEMAIAIHNRNHNHEAAHSQKHASTSKFCECAESHAKHRRSAACYTSYCTTAAPQHHHVTLQLTMAWQDVAHKEPFLSVSFSPYLSPILHSYHSSLRSNHSFLNSFLPSFVLSFLNSCHSFLSCFPFHVFLSFVLRSLLMLTCLLRFCSLAGFTCARWLPLLCSSAAFASARLLWLSSSWIR